MGGCARILFLPFALCSRDTQPAADDVPGLSAMPVGTNKMSEDSQQPVATSNEALPLREEPGLQTVDDAVLSAILLHIALSDEDDGFAQLLRFKARTLARTCTPPAPLAVRRSAEHAECNIAQAVSKRWRALVDEVHRRRTPDSTRFGNFPCAHGTGAQSALWLTLTMMHPAVRSLLRCS